MLELRQGCQGCQRRAVPLQADDTWSLASASASDWCIWCFHIFQTADLRCFQQSAHVRRGVWVSGHRLSSTIVCLCVCSTAEALKVVGYIVLLGCIWCFHIFQTADLYSIAPRIPPGQLYSIAPRIPPGQAGFIIVDGVAVCLFAICCLEGVLAEMRSQFQVLPINANCKFRHPKSYTHVVPFGRKSPRPPPILQHAVNVPEARKFDLEIRSQVLHWKVSFVKFATNVSFQIEM